MENVDILLVEDNPHDAEMAIRGLKKQFAVIHILHLKDGAEAIDYFFGAGEFARPKVVFLDLKMPKINGLEVLARVKGAELTKDIPVVVLTSSKESSDIETCYRLGANSYIVKPVDYENLMKAVKDLGYYWIQMNQGNQ